MKNTPHIPVLLQPIVQKCNLHKGDVVVDGTIGFGGHACALLKIIGEDGRYLGIDKDQKAIDYCQNHYQRSGLTLVQGQFSEIDRIAYENKFDVVDFILLDLGVSSPQLDDPIYGLSFLHDGPLDMRIGESSLLASDVINKWSAAELRHLFTENGQEATNRLVDKIIDIRQRKSIGTIFELKQIIELVVPFKKGINPSTQVFQALRIATNNELVELQKGLEKSIKLLKKGGRIAVISFHSGEDKIVKNYFKKESADCICPPNYPICQCSHKASLQILTKTSIVASDKEVKINPRSRSAKLRIALKI